MILLKKLTLQDFLSHKKTVIDFSPNTKILADGPSGAGKSSILDAITWALYGQGRADNRGMVRKGAKGGSVCLELAREEETVIITRKITAIGKHSLEVAIQQSNGSRAAYPLSGIKELQNWIDKELIGASYLLFINSIAYVQGNSESFVSQTAPKRKELLLEILKAEDYGKYGKYYESAKYMLWELDNDRNKASGQVQELEIRLQSLLERLNGRQAYVEAIVDNTVKKNDLEPIIADLEVKKASLTAAAQVIGILDGIINGLKSDIETANSAISLKRVKISEAEVRTDIMLKLLPGFTANINEANVKLGRLRTALAITSSQEAKRNELLSRKPVIHDSLFQEIKFTERQIAQIKAQPVCPSGDACPYSGDNSKHITELEAKIQSYNEVVLKETIALSEWSVEEKKLPPQVDSEVMMKEITVAEVFIKNLESEFTQAKLKQGDPNAIIEMGIEIIELNKVLIEKNIKLEEATKKKQEAEAGIKAGEITALENDLSSAKEKLHGFNDAISKATAMLENIDQCEKEWEEVENRIATIKTAEIPAIDEKMRKVSLVKEAFSSKGIETLVIDYILPRLEDRINEVLAKLSDFRVRLDTQRKSADGESMIEGLYIFVYNEIGEEMDFDNYSGGEKLRINVAISEALTSLHKSIGFRLMDETIIGLSQEMVQDFAMVLEELQNEYPQILVISHLLEIKSMFEKVITVKKNHGISTIAA